MKKQRNTSGKWTLDRLNKALDNRSPNYIKKHLCGPKIGKGKFRDTYVFKYDSSVVIKIERNINKGMFCNVTEWRNFCDSRWTPLEKWLAKCLLISATGQVLVQVRCDRIIDGVKKKMPKKIPSVFTDLHTANWGVYNGKWVCYDYPFFLNKWNMKKSKFVKV